MNEPKLAIQRWGRGEPMLALHGWQDNAGSFARLAPLLEGYEVIALDFVGHGLSDPLPEGGWHQFIEHLWDIHRSLVGPETPLHVLGHSMGGALGALYAGIMPDHVRSLISIDAVGPLSDSPAHIVERMRAALEARDAALPRARRHDTLAEAIGSRHATGHMSVEGASALAERGVSRDDEGRYYWHADQRLKLPSLLRLGERQVLALMGAIRCPVLFIEAESGQFKQPEGQVRRRLEAIQDRRVVTLPGHHHLHLDHPEAVAPVILDFLAGV